MKTTIKHIALGTLVFLLFTQMNVKDKEFFGEYQFSEFRDFGSLILKSNHKFIEEVRSCYSYKVRGEWKVEKGDVILIFKKKYEFNYDTLEIKRLDNKIDSLGNYKKLK